MYTNLIIWIKVVLLLLIVIKINLFAKNEDIKAQLVVDNSYGCSNCTLVAITSTIKEINQYFNYPEIKIYVCRELYKLLKLQKFNDNIIINKIEDYKDIDRLEGLYICNKDNFPLIYIKDFKNEPLAKNLKIFNMGNFYFNELFVNNLYNDTSEQIISYNSFKLHSHSNDSLVNIAVIEPNFNKIIIIKENIIIKQMNLLDNIKYFFVQDTKSSLKYEIDYLFSKNYFVSSYKEILDLDDSTITVLCQSLFDIKRKIIFNDQINDYVEANIPDLRGLIFKYNYLNDKTIYINELDSNFSDYLTPYYSNYKMFFLSNDFINYLFNKTKNRANQDSIVILEKFDFLQEPPKVEHLVNCSINDLFLKPNKLNETVSLDINNSYLLLNYFDNILFYNFKNDTYKNLNLEDLFNNMSIKYPYSLNNLIISNKYTVLNIAKLGIDKLYITSKYYNAGQLKYIALYEFDTKLILKSFKFFDMNKNGSYTNLNPIIISDKLYFIGFENNENINLLSF